ncbi:plasmid partitioning protein RepB [Phyllobacterium zundukense]|uniref:Plasmid partitioning protein RepB n=1 Tax=Phyllobacterium zundukense TaxID=1867719 RepID=A0ACD4CWD9_9HYPH|nr:plasmid partitioning protein RepB [Phyllobacterium zundukense]UXN57783.1 plasmid partitioning protein RepB [Phyllobacterium zundukense]
MARKNLLAGLADDTSDQSHSTASYPIRGASKSMIRSIDELAKQADRFLEGETVIEIDPATIDGSFVSDRMEDDTDQFKDLLEAIKERGQNSPVLVRPHPEIDGRFQIVFGHRRVRVARELGRKVRAVVKALDDKTHVIAQGQENSARANLTFIERAVFAKRLEDLGYDREVISSALAANAAAVSKMISVVSRVPASLIEKIGSAPSVGRERWVEFSLLVGRFGHASKLDAVVSDAAFHELDSSERFDRLFNALNKSAKPVKKTIEKKAVHSSWAPGDKSVTVVSKAVGKSYTLALRDKNAAIFGGWISENLEGLYRAFMESGKVRKTGD